MSGQPTLDIHLSPRSTDVHGRVILDVKWAPSPGGEAASVIDSITNLALLCSGAQGIIYDTALRGVRHQRLMSDRCCSFGRPSECWQPHTMDRCR